MIKSKGLGVIISVFVGLLVCVGLQAQQTDVDYISTMRMGPFKLGTPKADIEAVIGKTIELGGENGYETKVTYKGATYTLYFWGGDELILGNVSSSDSKLKTKSGMGIGSNKMQILGTYDKYSISVWNWVNEDKSIPRDKTQSIELRDDDAGTCIMFKTVDRIVTEIAVYYNEGC